MKTYNVLWCDDEHETLETIIDEAGANGIALAGFSNADEAVAELHRNYLKYDAVLLDGLFFSKAGQQGDAYSDKPLGTVLNALVELKAKKFLPKFVLSGQVNITEKGNPQIYVHEIERVYNKNIDGDTLQLWQDIKEAADQQEDTQIRHDYAQIFEICTDEYIGEYNQKALLNILRSIRNPHDSFDDELYFTQIRIILESMFRAANKLGILHDKCLEGGKVNLTESSLFMAGEQTKYLGVYCKTKHFNKIVSDSVKSILFITGAASHTVEADVKNNINLIAFRKEINSPYLLYSLTFSFMDVLLWFKSYADANSNYAANQAQWAEIASTNSWIDGHVIKIADNGFGTFLPNNSTRTLSIIPKIVADNGLKEGMEISVLTKEDTVNKKTLIDQIKVNGK
jgi:hypothetical protein